MKILQKLIILLLITGCSNQISEQNCKGGVNLPFAVNQKFTEIYDDQILKRALGPENEGRLYDGKVYNSNESVEIYRVWNSKKPYTKFGEWWAFEKPEGSMSKYRDDYNICSYWSPLDKLIVCKLKPDSTVVIGTGQSVECPDNKNEEYPVSDKLQIFLPESSESTMDCTDYDGEFNWRQTVAE